MYLTLINNHLKKNQKHGTLSSKHPIHVSNCSVKKVRMLNLKNKNNENKNRKNQFHLSAL
jgi:hypothetical protein